MYPILFSLRALLMDDEARRKCLLDESKIVQDIISRMANNSFLIKGWAVTLVVISLLFRGTYYHHLIALIPWGIFWIYDAYFLRLEKLYRELYDWLIANRLTSDEAFLDVSKKSIESRFGKKVKPTAKLMFSNVLIIFYGFLFAIIVFWILVNPT
jgi:hypothetical protein